MKIRFSKKGHLPIYQQIVNSVIRDIESGKLSGGFKLPTVRELAKEHGLAQGTVKHAYDFLEQLGYIEKSQGRGTFVCTKESGGQGSKKDLAMTAIDQLLDRMAELQFSTRETRIILDLKLRERENEEPLVTVAAVDCCPEALLSMCRQIMTIAHVDVQDYLLDSVLHSTSLFRPNTDFIVTTPTHFDELGEKTAPGQNILRIVMAITRDTLLAIARIPPESRIGIICASERFAHIISHACAKYGDFAGAPAVAYFGDHKGIQALLGDCDRIILPSEYLRFAKPREQQLFQSLEHPFITFQYQIENGSLLHLEEEIEKRGQEVRPLQ